MIALVIPFCKIQKQQPAGSTWTPSHLKVMLFFCLANLIIGFFWKQVWLCSLGCHSPAWAFHALGFEPILYEDKLFVKPCNFVIRFNKCFPSRVCVISLTRQTLGFTAVSRFFFFRWFRILFMKVLLLWGSGRAVLFSGPGEQQGVGPDLQMLSSPPQSSSSLRAVISTSSEKIITGCTQ